MKKISFIKDILMEIEWNRILESHWQSLEDTRGKRAGGYKNMAMKM